MILKHHYIYLNNLNQKIKIKQIDNVLFKDLNGYIYYKDGTIIGRSYVYNLTKQLNKLKIKEKLINFFKYI